MLIKVCGMRDAQNIRDVEALGIDLMGFICWPERKSRYVESRPEYMPACGRVGVFVNPTLEFVEEKVAQLGLTHIQLHGKETPLFCREVKAKMGLTVMKAISIASEEDVEQTALYEDEVDLFVFDTKTKLVGGSGEQFDWDVLQAYRGTKPFLLAGGIGPDDGERIARFHHPRWVGIDLNSKFESAPAMKDVEALKRLTTDNGWLTTDNGQRTTDG